MFSIIYNGSAYRAICQCLFALSVYHNFWSSKLMWYILIIVNVLSFYHNRQHGLQDSMPILTLQIQTISARHYTVSWLECVILTYLFVLILFSHYAHLLKLAEVNILDILISSYRLILLTLICLFVQIWMKSDQFFPNYSMVLARSFVFCIANQHQPMMLFCITIPFHINCVQNFSNLWMKSRMKILCLHSRLSWTSLVRRWLLMLLDYARIWWEFFLLERFRMQRISAPPKSNLLLFRLLHFGNAWTPRRQRKKRMILELLLQLAVYEP